MYCRADSFNLALLSLLIPFRFSLPSLCGYQGIAYQYYAIFCWYLSISLPYFGPFLGSIFLNPMVSNMAGLPPTSYASRSTPLSALMNFPYFYFHMSWHLESLGLAAGFDKRHKISRPAIYAPEETLPVLFIYGSDKGFKFHSLKVRREKGTRSPSSAQV